MQLVSSTNGQSRERIETSSLWSHIGKRNDSMSRSWDSRVLPHTPSAELKQSYATVESSLDLTLMIYQSSQERCPIIVNASGKFSNRLKLSTSPSVPAKPSSD